MASKIALASAMSGDRICFVPFNPWSISLLLLSKNTHANPASFVDSFHEASVKQVMVSVSMLRFFSLPLLVWISSLLFVSTCCACSHSFAATRALVTVSCSVVLLSSNIFRFRVFHSDHPIHEKTSVKGGARGVRF